MPVANDTPDEQDYDVTQGGGNGPSTTGCLDAGSIVVTEESGTGPWAVEFRNDSNLTVTLTDSQDCAVLYKDSAGTYHTKKWVKNTCV